MDCFGLWNSSLSLSFSNSSSLFVNGSNQSAFSFAHFIHSFSSSVRLFSLVAFCSVAAIKFLYIVALSNFSASENNILVLIISCSFRALKSCSIFRWRSYSICLISLSIASFFSLTACNSNFAIILGILSSNLFVLVSVHSTAGYASNLNDKILEGLIL